MTVACAVDLGLRNVGVAWDGDSDTFTCPAGLRGGDRLGWWADTFAVYTSDAAVDLVSVELVVRCIFKKKAFKITLSNIGRRRRW